MNSSDQINELATALSELHGTIGDPGKAGSGQYGKYVKLDDILTLLREALPPLGLSFVQLPEGDGASVAQVTTRIMHTSGQWIEATASSEAQGNRGTTPIQAFGATVTYLRRYSLMSAFGLTGDDDNDGDAPQAPPARKPQPQAQPVPKPGGPTYQDGSPVYDGQLKAFNAYAEAHEGNAPRNVHNLKAWVDKVKSAQATQPALVDEPANGAYQD